MCQHYGLSGWYQSRKVGVRYCYLACVLHLLRYCNVCMLAVEPRTHTLCTWSKEGSHTKPCVTLLISKANFEFLTVSLTKWVTNAHSSNTPTTNFIIFKPATKSKSMQGGQLLQTHCFSRDTYQLKTQLALYFSIEILVITSVGLWLRIISCIHSQIYTRFDLSSLRGFQNFAHLYRSTHTC